MPHEVPSNLRHVSLTSKNNFNQISYHHFPLRMGKKKMKLPFLAKSTRVRSSSSSWAFPSCQQPRTLSFRGANDDIFKTSNSAYLDATVHDTPESTESFFTNSSESASFSTASEDSRPVETVIRGLRSDRLFFDPDETSSILESKAAPEAENVPFKDSVALSMESQDPYVDFRKSMEEIVEAHGVKDWEGLEELLCWYLRVNGKTNHAYIVGAFVDLLVSLAFASFPSTSSSSHSPSSPLSFYSSSNLSSSISTIPCVSCLEVEEEGDTPTPSSSSFIEEIKEEIKHQDEASSSNV